MLELVSLRWAWTLAMLVADLSDPAWMAARMLASDGSAGDSAAVAPEGSCRVGAGWRRGLVERRSVGEDAPSRSGIAKRRGVEVPPGCESRKASQKQGAAISSLGRKSQDLSQNGLSQNGLSQNGYGGFLPILDNCLMMLKGLGRFRIILDTFGLDSCINF